MIPPVAPSALPPGGAPLADRRSRIRRGRLGTRVVAASMWGTAWASDEVLTVGIREMRFEPASLVVKAGSVVRWVNQEKRTSHSVLFTGPGGFESERFMPGEHYERRFDQPGRYAYTCGPHPEMTGVIVVEPLRPA